MRFVLLACLATLGTSFSIIHHQNRHHSTTTLFSTPHPDHDLLLRAARGEITSRTPVWLMRQAGRYMAAFREYSTKYPFRHRSETPSIAVELSLQCWRKYKMDGVIMFSDILTPLPAIGIEWDIVPGKGPVISTEIASLADVKNLPSGSDFDPASSLPFVGETLRTLRAETEGKTTLIGFVGAPWTLAAYTIEQSSSKHCNKIKKMQMNDTPAIEMFLDKLAEVVGKYMIYQVDNGAQVVQIFESWAHQISPTDFAKFAKPATQKAIKIFKAKHPNVPVIFFANGGSGYLEQQKDMGCDMVCLDWGVDMKEGRARLGGEGMPVSGNIDPSVLYGSEEFVRAAVRECVEKAGGAGNRHVLNLGHGVQQEVSEEAVGWLVDEVKKIKKR